MNKLNLTLKETLEYTQRMWQLLANDSDRMKRTALVDVFPQVRGLMNTPIHDCFCCQYVVEHHNARYKCGMACASLDDPHKNIEDLKLGREMLALCPLRELWPDGCEAKGAAWQRYSDGPEEGEEDYNPSVYAQQIADAAAKELEKLAKLEVVEKATSI